MLKYIKQQQTGIKEEIDNKIIIGDFIFYQSSINGQIIQTKKLIREQWHSVQSLSPVRLFETPWTTVRQASLSITNSWSSPKFESIKSVTHSTISSFVIPFSSCPQSFLASGSFQMSQVFASCGKSNGVSASTSVFPMNMQDWSPLG